MKKSVTLYSVFLIINSFAQNPILHWKFLNPMEYGSEFYYWEFDVGLSCDMSGTYHTTLSIFIEYDTVAFGTNVVAEGMLTYEPGELLQGTYQGNPKYALVEQTDHSPGIIKLVFHGNMLIANPLFLNQVPQLPVYSSLCKLTFKIKQLSWNGFFRFAQAEMNSQQYYVDPSHPTETKYGSPPSYGGVYENEINSVMGWHGTWYNLNVFLQGAYDTTLHAMRCDLAANGFLPLSQPYAPGLPWYGNSLPCWYYNGNESVASFPPDVVDWVMVEVRDAPDAASATAATTMVKGAFFLKSNGEIVGMNGFQPIEFDTPRLVRKGMFVIVWHRNHLGIMNAQPIQPSSPGKCNDYNYNFYSGENKVYGGINGHVELEPCVWGMISGDGNADKNIGTQDKSDVWVKDAGISGYRPGDFNLSGNCDNADKNDFYYPNAGKSSQVPD